MSDHFSEGPSRTSPPVPTKMTPEEARLKDDIDKCRQNLMDLQTRYNQLMTACNHRVFSDKPGFLYDARTCSVCGIILGLI